MKVSNVWDSGSEVRTRRARRLVREMGLKKARRMLRDYCASDLESQNRGELLEFACDTLWGGLAPIKSMTKSQLVRELSELDDCEWECFISGEWS